MPAHWRQQRIPADLSVKVGVDVDEPGRHVQAIGIEFPRGGPRFATDLGDHAIINGDVAAEGRASASIHNRAGANDGFVGHLGVPSPR